MDWQRRELRLPTAKAKRVQYPPLAELAIAILGALPRDEGNPHIFEVDFFRWATETAKALREGRVADVDLEHVADETRTWSRRSAGSWRAS